MNNIFIQALSSQFKIIMEKNPAIGLGLVNTEPYTIYIANINMNKLIIIVPLWVCKDDNCIV